MSKSTNSNPNPKPKDWQNDPLSVQRGDYTSSPLSTLIFTTGRLASGPLCYLLIKHHPLGKLFNIPPPPTGGTLTLSSLSHLGLSLGLTPTQLTFPKLPFLTALMPTILSTKHIIWATTMYSERMTIPFALFGAIADLLYESTSTLIFTTCSINPLWSESVFHTGMTIYYTGVAIELLAEIQRLIFKRRPENRGELCTTGFWGVTRHINYTANVVFGVGFGLALGGPVYVIASGGMYVSNFVWNAIPSIEAYCGGKYGERWGRYCEQVPWRLIPWIY